MVYPDPNRCVLCGLSVKGFCVYVRGKGRHKDKVQHERGECGEAVRRHVESLRAALEKADALLAIQDHPTLARGEGAALVAYRDARGKVE